MTDTSELVKQLLRESRHHTDVKAEAAKAIKRLEREFADFNRLALKHREELEQQLATARAEIGQLRKAITLFTCVIKSGEGWSDECQRVRDEALATPAPEHTE